MVDAKNVRGRIALVSGGGSGIGLATAKKLAGAGIKTIAADIQFPSSFPDSIIGIECNIANSKEVSDLFEKIKNQTGLPNILVCNAGRGIHEKLTEGDPEKWKEVLDLNIMGALRLIRAFVPFMTEEKQGDVIFTSSVSAQRAYEYGGIYAASKCALEKVAETLRLEVQNDNVRITTVAPGVVDTGFFKNSISATHTAEDIGWGAVSPEEIAEMIFFALSQKQGTSLNYLTVRPTVQPF